MDIRPAFFERLVSEFYIKLKAYPVLSEWETPQTYRLSRTIIAGKEREINQYLDNNRFTLKDIDKATEGIIKQILLPEVEKITI